MSKRKRCMVTILILAAFIVLACAGTWLIAENETWVLTQYADTSGNQGMFYTIRNSLHHTLIVVDGGWPENENYVRAVLKENGNVVDAWFLTHYHGDHVSAFNAIYQDPRGVRIKRVYASPLDWETFAEVSRDWDTPESFRTFLDRIRAEDVTYVRAGDRFRIANLQVEVFHSYDESLREYYGDDIPNNASLIFKVSGKKDSILFCGDAHQAPLADYLTRTWGERLKAEYVQTGHHGNHSFPKRFYDMVSPETAFFDAPEWLMTGEEYTARKLKKYFTGKRIKTVDYQTAPNSCLFR